MLEESKEHQGRSSTMDRLYDSEFYTAIMEEDSGRIEDLSKKHSSNFRIEVQGAAPGDFWKGLAILPLHLAVTNRRVKSVQSLLSTGTDPELRDHLGRTALHSAITSWPRVLTSEPNSKMKNAIIGRCAQAEGCLRLLCEHAVNINAETGDGSHQTAVHLLVRYMALPAAHILVSHGADVNAVDSNGMTPLHMAAGSLHKDMIACLIKEGADINMAVKHSRNTPLHLAVVAVATKVTKTPQDGTECIVELLERGAEVNALNKDGVTPLQEVCKMGNAGLVDLLLRYGASINKLSKAGENCLFLFLSHRPNVKNRSLLVKLFHLTSPLTLCNREGHLPSTLTLPCFFKQRDQLLELIQQPRRLRDICKSVIYRTHIRDKTEELRNILPQRVYDFVFNYWEDLHISFETDK